MMLFPSFQVIGSGCGTVAALRPRSDYQNFSISWSFAGSLAVEPMGFEPTPSAVQSQIHNIVVVRRCSKTPAKS
jgi:hypothetical protein